MMLKSFKYIALTLICLSLVVLHVPVQAQSVGTSSGLLFITANTARATALGGAGGTLTDDPGVMFYNPAGLTSITRSHGLFTHQTGIAEDYSEIVNFVLPLSSYGTFGIAFVYHGMPDLNDAINQPSVEVNDIMGMISVGRSGKELLNDFSYGLSVKFLNSVIGEYSANTFAADLGVQWKPSKDSLLGLSVVNLGMPMKFIDEADQLPLRFVLSGKYDLLTGFLEKFFIAMDIEQTLEEETRVHLGGEFVYSSILAGRLGYIIAPGSTDGLAFGLGIRTAIGAYSFRFDYSYKLTNWSNESLDGQHLFTVGLIY